MKNVFISVGDVAYLQDGIGRELQINDMYLEG